MAGKSGCVASINSAPANDRWLTDDSCRRITRRGTCHATRCARTTTWLGASFGVSPRLASLRARWRAPGGIIGALHLAVNRARGTATRQGTFPATGGAALASIWSLSYRTPAGAMPALCLTTAATVRDSTLRTRSIPTVQIGDPTRHCFLSFPFPGRSNNRPRRFVWQLARNV